MADRKVYDITAAAQGLNPFGLLEIKIVKEGETDFTNVRYVDIDPLFFFSIFFTVNIEYKG